jgi:hypothetical protein
MKAASRISETIPDSSQSGSLKPGRPVVRLRTKPANIPAAITTPSDHASLSGANTRRSATSSAPTPPAMNRTPR